MGGVYLREREALTIISKTQSHRDYTKIAFNYFFFTFAYAPKNNSRKTLEEYFNV